MKSNHTLIIIIGALVALLLGGLIWRFSYILQSSHSIATLVWCLILLGVLIPSLATRMRVPQAFKYGIAWIGIFMAILVGYSFEEELYGVSNKLKSNLFPHIATSQGNNQISFTKAMDGHFYIETVVDGIPIRFMVDTGATRTTLTLYDAKRLGFDVDNLAYNQPVHTAKGVDFVATIHLKEMKVGDLTLKDIYASVSKNLTDHSLLGMNFLKKLKGFRMEGNSLTLEAH